MTDADSASLSHLIYLPVYPLFTALPHSYPVFLFLSYFYPLLLYQSPNLWTGLPNNTLSFVCLKQNQDESESPSCVDVEDQCLICRETLFMWVTEKGNERWALQVTCKNNHVRIKKKCGRSLVDEPKKHHILKVLTALLYA